MTMALEDLAKHIEAKLGGTRRAPADRAGRADHGRRAASRSCSVLTTLRDDSAVPVRGADRHLRRRLSRARASASMSSITCCRRARTSASASSARRTRHARPERGRAVPGRQLVRAGGLRHVRHPVLRPSRPAPHPHRLRLPGLSRCARTSRSPATSRCATTTTRSAWSTSR